MVSVGIPPKVLEQMTYLTLPDHARFTWTGYGSAMVTGLTEQEAHVLTEALDQACKALPERPISLEQG